MLSKYGLIGRERALFGEIRREGERKEPRKTGESVSNAERGEG